MKTRVSVLIMVLVMALSGVTAVAVIAQQTQEKTSSTSQLNPSELTLVNQIGGASMRVITQGQYAYLGMGPRLAVFDIQDAAHPVLVGKSDVLSGTLYNMAISGDYIYAAVGGSNIVIIDVQNPTNPNVTAVFTTTARIDNIAVRDDYAYVMQSGKWQNDTQQYIGSGLYVYEISATATLSQVAYLDINKSNWFNLALDGDYAYIVADNPFPGSVLLVVGIADPVHPVLLNDLYHGERIENRAGIAVADGYLYAGMKSNGWYGLAIYDLTEPMTPTLKFEPAYSNFPTANLLPLNIEIRNNTAYVAGSSAGLIAIDVSDPTAPFDVASYTVPFPSRAVDVVLKDQTALVAYAELGFHMVAISQTNNMTATMVYNEIGWAMSVANKDEYAYVADQLVGVRVFNTADPTHLSQVSVHHLDEGGSVSSLSLHGDRLYAIKSQSFYSPRGYSIIDTTNVVTLTETGFYVPNRFGSAYDVSGDYLFSAAGLYGMRVTDVSSPTTIYEAGAFTTAIDYARDVAVSGNYAYLADGSNGLRILDISSPSAPTETTTMDLGYTGFVVVSGDYAYVISGGDTLNIINISDPTHPDLVSSEMVLDSPATFLAVVDGYLAIDAFEGLYIFDVSDPMAPVEVFFAPASTYPAQVSTNNGYLYVSRGNNGLYIFGPDMPLESTKKVYLPAVIKGD